MKTLMTMVMTAALITAPALAGPEVRPVKNDQGTVSGAVVAWNVLEPSTWGVKSWTTLATLAATLVGYLAYEAGDDGSRSAGQANAEPSNSSSSHESDTGGDHTGDIYHGDVYYGDYNGGE